LHPQWLLGRRRPPKALSNIVGKVLDIGSADGWLQQHLSSECFYVAFDYPATATHLYRSRPHVFGDAQKLPFADDSFDHVACLEVLEHIRDPDEVLHEVARVLTSGGRAHFTMPFLYPIHDAPHDYQRWTEFGWKRSAEAAGFEVHEIAPAHHPVISAAVLGCLALAAPLQSARLLRQALLLLPTILLVCAVNIVAWLVALLWPAWRGMTLGYQIELRRK
jgi:SAM-dependent methyltransferase